MDPAVQEFISIARACICGGAQDKPMLRTEDLEFSPVPGGAETCAPAGPADPAAGGPGPKAIAGLGGPAVLLRGWIRGEAAGAVTLPVPELPRCSMPG